VSEIDANGHLEIDIGDYITLVDEDIDSSDPIFKVVSELHIKDQIQFSGNIDHDDLGRHFPCNDLFNRKFYVHLKNIRPLV